MTSLEIKKIYEYLKLFFKIHVYGFLIRSKRKLVFFTVLNLLFFFIGVLDTVAALASRQLFVVLFLFLLDFSENALGELSRDLQRVESLIHQQTPHVRYFGILGLFIYASFFVVKALNFVSCNDLDENLLVFLAFLFPVICFFSILSIVELYQVTTNPQIVGYFDIISSIKHNGVCSFSTFKAAAHVCKTCAKLTVAAVALDEGFAMYSQGDPSAYGFTSQILLKNFSVHGIYSRDSKTQRLAIHVLENVRDPESVKPIFVDPNGRVSNFNLLKYYYDPANRIPALKGHGNTANFGVDVNFGLNQGKK